MVIEKYSKKYKEKKVISYYEDVEWELLCNEKVKYTYNSYDDNLSGSGDYFEEIMDFEDIPERVKDYFYSIKNRTYIDNS